MCFIAGASPSLRFVKTDLLSNYITISVNSSLLKFPNCNYFVTDDHGVSTWNYWQKTARESKCIKFLFADKLRNYVSHIDPNTVVFFDHRYWSTRIENKEVYHKENLIVHDDPNIPIIGARSSVASAINIAFIMGCDPIVLLGVDNCYEGIKRYYWQFDGEPKAYETNNRIFSIPNRGLIKNKPVDQHCVDYDLYWQQFAEMNPKLLDGRIINCAVNGILDVFPKVELTDVLQRYGDRTNG